jgi:hypothetical protein
MIGDQARHVKARIRHRFASASGADSVLYTFLVLVEPRKAKSEKMMSEASFTMIENGQTHSIPATMDDSVLRLSTEPALAALGWTQKPEGLCQGDVCIPIAGYPDLISAEGIDLVGLGEALGRPIAVDTTEAVVSIGAETNAHGAELAGGVAPDFTLPDLTGKEYSLSSFKGKKVLLIAYASW